MSAGPVEIVVGARPNFVKAAPLWRALEGAALPLRLVHTGQHRDAALAVGFGRQLGLPEPHVRLDVPAAATHGRQTATLLEAYERHLLAAPERPRAVVVIGDVNSTLAAALAAAKLGIPVAHVEAGLRSFDRSMPEETNRVLVDAMSDLWLASEPSARANLEREGADPSRIHLVGSLTVDALVHALPAARALDVPARLGLRGARFAYATLHRPSNVDDPARLAAIVGALEKVAELLPVVLPVHPRTAARLAAAKLRDRLDGIARSLPPLSYHEAIGWMSAASVVVTDSGGVQEETTWLGVPCLTLRDNTERPITVERGTNGLVGRDPGALPACVAAALDARWRAPEIDAWDGRAAERAAAALLARYA